jgi:hypothetical protein
VITVPAPRIGLRYSRVIALSAAIATSLASTLGLFLVARMRPGVPTTAFTNIAGVLLSLGIVAIVYDFFLRNSVLYETLNIVGIKQSVASIGLREIRLGSTPNWRELCSGAERISILLNNPLVWVQSEWNSVLDAAKTRAVDVCIYIPRAGWSDIASLSERLGFEKSDFVPQLNNARNFLETSWKTEARNIKDGSKFTLRSYKGIAAYEIALFDDQVLLIIPDSIQKRLSAPTLMLEFGGTEAANTNSWLRDQLAILDAEPTIEFTDEVRR